MKRLFATMTILAFTIYWLVAAEIKLNAPAPDFSLKDSQGKTHKLSDYKGKYVVLEWVNYGCPFVKKHYNSGNMQTLQKKYTEKGVIWLSICSSSPGKQGHYSPEEINKMKAEWKANYTAYLIDEDGTVGHLYGATSTPHMYVIDPEGKLIYAGAIDDKPTTNLEDVKKAKNYVAEILDAALAGKKVQPMMTTSYGCSVKYK